MRRTSAVGVIILGTLVASVASIASNADDDHPKSLAVKAAEDEYRATTAKPHQEYESQLKAALKSYTEKLDLALDGAMQSKDLTEANRIDAFKKRVLESSAPTPNGGQTRDRVFLSDLEPETMSGHSVAKKGICFNSKCVVTGVYSPNGIGLHPANGGSAAISFKLPGNFRTFQATVALNDDVKVTGGFPSYGGWPGSVDIGAHPPLQVTSGGVHPHPRDKAPGTQGRCAGRLYGRPLRLG